MSNPTRLPAFNGDEGIVHVVIETEKRSRNKFSYDEDLNIFRLKKVLPEGMSFPYDFGFIPSTLAEDGDPLDVLCTNGRTRMHWLFGRVPNHRRYLRRTVEGWREGSE